MFYLAAFSQFITLGELIANQSLQTIARNLGRAASTISREIKRNDGTMQYRAAACFS